MKITDLLVAVLIVVLFFGLAGCGSDQETGRPRVWTYVLTDVAGKEHTVKITSVKQPWSWESVSGDGTMYISIGDEKYARIVKLVKSSEEASAK